MKTCIRLWVALATLTVSGAASATLISGDVTGGGHFTGSVTRSNAWVTSNALEGETVNFWTLTGNAGDRVSLVVDSAAIEFGISLYSGVVDPLELLFEGFNNAGSFADNLFIAGTNPTTGALGTSLLDILLPSSGIYTLAIGGEAGFPFDGNFGYDLDVAVTPVPLPGALLLMLTGLGGLGAFGRRGTRR